MNPWSTAGFEAFGLSLRGANTIKPSHDDAAIEALLQLLMSIEGTSQEAKTSASEKDGENT